MKKILLIFIGLLFLFTLVSCETVNEEQEPQKQVNDDPVVNPDDPKPDDPKTDDPVVNPNNNSNNDEKEELLSISLNNLERFYLVGNEDDIDITIYPSDIEIKNIEYKSSDEEIIIVDNSGHLKAIKEGTCLITITVNGKSIGRIIIVEKESEDEELQVGSVPTIYDIEEQEKRREAREQEAREHGFSSYREYREYLHEQFLQQIHETAQEKYEEACAIASEMGISIEDYLCLTWCGLTYEELQNNFQKVGYSVEFCEDYRLINGRQVGSRGKPNSYYYRIMVIRNYLNVTLGSLSCDPNQVYYYPNCPKPDQRYYYPSNEVFVNGYPVLQYGDYYYNVLILNNLGYEIDEAVWSKIEPLLPEAEKLVKKCDYLVEEKEVSFMKAYYYVCEEIYGEKSYYGFTDQKGVTTIYYLLTDEERELFDNYMKDYKENEE